MKSILLSAAMERIAIRQSRGYSSFTGREISYMSEVSEREWDNWRCLFTTPCEKWINLTDAELQS